ncbi:Uncharacterized protein BM_BM3193 [Brugia malayi]|uniref:Uncharacterized protein n=1 Tax=Brugia malayi TaxID=6279 RepID=A0A4E9FSV4_BRUMA|nr:Uncharacterized protein BM_BM3193 [Brugia malayi]VIO99737.1 Uncharacterized protein BM_BM3193 [Brugia malayi]
MELGITDTICCFIIILRNYRRENSTVTTICDTNNFISYIIINFLYQCYL